MESVPHFDRNPQPDLWAEYGKRDETRREHLSEMERVLGFRSFGAPHYRSAIDRLVKLAVQTDKGIVLAQAMVESLRKQSILLPSVAVIERVSAEAITRANRRIYATLEEAEVCSLHRDRGYDFDVG